MSRTRTTVTGGFTTEHHYLVYNQPGDVLTQDTVTYSGEQKVKSITDTEVPGFKKLLACGQFLPINPVSISTVVTTRTPGSGSWRLWNPETGATTRDSHGEYWGTRGFEIPIPPVNAALTEAVVTSAAARAVESTMDLMTFLAEFRQTQRLVVSRSESVWRTIFSCARTAASAKKLETRIQRFNRLWLEARYGWRPLIFDTYNAVEALQRKKEKLMLIKGRARQTEEFTEDLSGHIAGSNESTYWDETMSLTRQYRGFAYGQVIEPGISEFGANPVLTAWELVPWSFVVDWFVDIGSWIQAQTPQLSGTKLLGVGYSIQETLRRETNFSWVWDVLPNSSGSYSGMKYVVESKTYERGPAVVPIIPAVNPRITLPKIIDLVALALTRKAKLMNILGRGM